MGRAENPQFADMERPSASLAARQCRGKGAPGAVSLQGCDTEGSISDGHGIHDTGSLSWMEKSVNGNRALVQPAATLPRKH